MSRHGSGGYEKILAVIGKARAAIRRSELAAGLGWTTLVVAAAVLVLAALDNLLHLPPPARIGLLAAAVFASAFTFYRKVVKALGGRLPDDAVAVRIEKAAGAEDNSLINALQLGRERDEGGLSGAIVRSVVERGATTAARFSPGRVVNRRRLSRAVGLGSLAVGLVILYAVVFGARFRNAVERYARPTAFIPPVSSIDLEVQPGDASVFPGEPLRISVRSRDAVLGSAVLHIRRGEDFEPAEMLFDGRQFSFSFDHVDKPFEYRVEAADSWSDAYSVSLKEPPSVERLTLACDFPPHLGLPPTVEEDAAGDIRAPVGTKVRIDAEFTQPIRRPLIRLNESSVRMTLTGEKTATGEVTVLAQDTWSLAFETHDRRGDPDPVRHRITALPDEPPDVTITAPGKDLVVTLPARVPVTIKARDDYGLGGEVQLIVRRGDSGDAAVIGRWATDHEKEKVVTQAIEIDRQTLLPGEVLTYYAVARDHYPPAELSGGLPPRRLESRSRTFTITIRSQADRAQDAQNALTDLESRLRDLLEREEAILRDTEALRDGAAGGRIGLSALPARTDSLAYSQSAFGADMAGVARSVPEDVVALEGIRSMLLILAANEVIDSVRRIQDSRSRDEVGAAVADLDAAVRLETKVVEKLRFLLGQVQALLGRMKEDPEGWIDEKMDEADRDAALRDAIARLKKFIREQEDVLEQTRALEEKDVDDFTEDDLALLEKLAAQESELSRFLKDLKDDLSKVPDQDFSNSTILKELIEAYSEVELAADALTRKSVELAVPREQSGLELAESLTENIEKWLPDARDSVKWNMEEFDGEYPDVPMADLPEQLEDLIGDLIEDEEQLSEDADDVTSGWADSIDKGAGWGVSDGPISNMSAQGKTGNTLPNSSEVGGRSGEGRTGRSHGEMVEGEATGKGGRRTPTRLTPDAWEGKSVKDSSKDPLGGATGGGKLAGGAGEGLRGPLPPEVKADLGRLQGNQVSIRQRAERLDRMLKSLHYPTEDFSRSVVLMKDLEEALRRGDVAEFSRRHRLLISQMKDGQNAILDHARVVRDRSRAVPKELMREMESVDLAGLPEGYREFLREYYKILSRGGAR